MFAKLTVPVALWAALASAASAQTQKIVVGADGAKGGDASVTIIVIPHGGNGGPGGNAYGPGAKAGNGGAGGNATVNGMIDRAIPQSEPKAPAGSKVTFTTRENRDLDGNDIMLSGSQIGLRNIDLEGCQNVCAAMTECVAYAWTKTNRSCYPKRSFGALNLDVTSSVGVRTPAKMPPLVERDYRWQPYGSRRFRGSVSNVSWTPSADVCQSACADALNCVAYTYDRNASGQNCSFFRLIDGWDKDAAVASAAKTQSPEKPPVQVSRPASSGSLD